MPAVQMPCNNLCQYCYHQRNLWVRRRRAIYRPYAEGVSNQSQSHAALQRIVSVLTRLINNTTESTTSGEWRFEVALDAETTISLQVQKQGRRDWFVAFSRDD